MLTFDEASHTYFWQGEKVPNVTRIIGHLTDYSHIPPDALTRAQEEGKAVHRMVELHCQGKPYDLPEWMVPHHKAMLKFIADTGFEPWLSEQKLYHPVMRYAGTLDLVGEIRHLTKGWNGVWLIDVKRSLYAGPAIGLQLAGYDGALRADKTMPKTERRGALRLGKDGNYRLDPFEDREDYPAFLACLSQLRWREKHYGSRT